MVDNIKMTDFDFINLALCENEPISSGESWFSDTSDINTPISSSHSQEYELLTTDVSEPMITSSTKKTRVKWTTAEDLKLRKLFTKFPE
jgi:hypothetical protein